MSTHYLVDTFSASLPTARIVDVLTSTTGASQAQVGHIIRIPDEVSVQNPTNLGDLLTKKYLGMLAAYAGYSYITYDDMLDPAGIDLAAVPAASRKCALGGRGSVSFEPSSIIQTTMVSLAATPSQAYILFELYQWTYNDAATALLTRTYQEIDHNPTDIVAEVTFDNGIHWYAVTDGVILNVPLAGQGTEFMLRLTATASASKTWLGSWAVIY